MARVEHDLSPSRAMERDLVLAFQSGEAAAFETIVRTCRPAAERICRRLLINPADVEEAVQETLVRAYQGLPRFNGSFALTAWIARIATNVCLDALRASSRRPRSVAPLQPNMEPVDARERRADNQDPEEYMQQAAEAEEVRQVLASLPERHRTALVLREFEGLSHRRIAEMLDTSPARVKALIHRAKAGFRRAWEDEHPRRLAAFAPLLVPVNWVRRLVGRAPELDHGAATSTATSAATVAASPAAQTLLSMAGERATAALAALMVAGTVTLAVQQPTREPRAEEPIVEFVQAPVQSPEDGRLVREARDKPAREKTEPESEPSQAAAAQPARSAAADDALRTAKDTIGTRPQGHPAPEPPAAPPTPAIPTQPTGFLFSFGSDRTSSSYCECGSAPVVTSDEVEASQDSFTRFSQQISAAAIRDATGRNAWPVEITQSGDQYRHVMTFTVTTADGISVFDAIGSVLRSKTEVWGGWTLAFHGTYLRRSGPIEKKAELPQRGTYDALLTFSWREHRLVAAVFQLFEAT